eukprot:5508066-Prymnesium_polylepis.1
MSHTSVILIVSNRGFPIESVSANILPALTEAHTTQQISSSHGAIPTMKAPGSRASVDGYETGPIQAKRTIGS